MLLTSGIPFVLFKIVGRDNFISVSCYICEIFIQANTEEGSSDIKDIRETVVLEGHYSIVASLARSAMYVNGSILWNLIQTFAELTYGGK